MMLSFHLFIAHNIQYNIENLFDSNGEIEDPDGHVEHALKKEYKRISSISPGGRLTSF